MEIEGWDQRVGKEESVAGWFVLMKLKRMQRSTNFRRQALPLEMKFIQFKY